MTRTQRAELQLYDPKIEKTFKRLRRLQKRRIITRESKLIQDSIPSSFFIAQILKMVAN